MHRYFKLLGLQPHRSESFKLSTDPFFIEKLRDVVGLYLSPPENALVRCVDEKSQCQALERTQPMVSADSILEKLHRLCARITGTEHWAATTAGHSGDIVRDVMLAAVENRFGNELHTPSEIERLSDNGSGYTADDTLRFAAAFGLKPLTTPVCSPQSNGMTESFVKTMKRDYAAFMPKPDAGLLHAP